MRIAEKNKDPIGHATDIDNLGVRFWNLSRAEIPPGIPFEPSIFAGDPDWEAK
jgi:hypothetical protein